MNYKREIIAGLAFLALFIIFRIPLLDIPLERDEGEYAFIASMDWGEFQPYKDAICQKPPIIFFIYKGAFLLFGESVLAVRFFVSIIVFTNTVFVFYIARKLSGNACAVASSLSYLVLGSLADAFLSHSANCEVFMTTFLLMGFLFLTAERRTYLSIFSSGILYSLAIFSKPVALPVVLWSFIYIYKSPRFIISYIIGLFIPTMLLLFYFIYEGALHEAMFWVFTYNFKYASAVSLFNYPIIFFNRMKEILDIYLLPILLLSFIGLLKIFNPVDHKNIHFFGWSLASMVGVSIGGYFRPHFFQQVLPSIAIFCGLGVITLTTRVFPVHKKLRYILSGILLIFIIVPVMRQSHNYLRLYPHEKIRRIYSGNPFDIAEEIGSFIRRQTMPGSKVFILGSEPEIYFHTKRINHNKFIITYPLFYVTHFSSEWHRSIITQMSQSLPEIIVIVPLAHSVGNEYYNDMPLTQFLEKQVRKQYEIIGVCNPNTERNGYNELTQLVNQTKKNIALKEVLEQTPLRKLDGKILILEKFKL